MHLIADNQSISLNLKDKKLPPFIIRPLLENAIEHGIFHRENIGEIKINLQIDNDQLIITIEDNGIGINKSQKINSWKEAEMKQTSVSLIKELLLNNFEIIDLQSPNGESEGTKAIVKVKLI